MYRKTYTNLVKVNLKLYPYIKLTITQIKEKFIDKFKP